MLKYFVKRRTEGRTNGDDFVDLDTTAKRKVDRDNNNTEGDLTSTSKNDISDSDCEHSIGAKRLKTIETQETFPEENTNGINNIKI